MKRALPILFVLAAGLAIGYVIGSQSESPIVPDTPARGDRPRPAEPAPAVPPPVVPDHSAEVAELSAEVDRLKAELAKRPDPTGPDAGATSPVRLAEATADPMRGAIRVLVADEDGSPIVGTQVGLTRYVGGNRAESTSAVSGSDGFAEFRDLAGGRCYVSATLAGGAKSAQITVTPGRVTELRLRVVRGAIVTGIVSEYGKGPLAKVSVTLSDRSGAVSTVLAGTTDAEGRYTIRDVPPGTYRITTSGGSIGYSRRPQDQLVVALPGPVTKDIVAGIPGLSGVVLDKDTGRPIAGVSVQIQTGAFASTTTDTAGKFVFLDIPPGLYRLVVSRAGYGLIFLKDVKGDKPLSIELRRAATIRFTVTRPDGQPYIGRLYLGISPEKKGEGTSVGTGIRTDEDGRGSYAKIVPGLYRLHLKADGVGEVKISVTVPVGETSVDVRLK